jgi:hypothetical protein
MRLLKVTGKWAFWTTPIERMQSPCLHNVSGNEDDAFRSLSYYKIAPRYTGSLDSITALIEWEFPYRLWTARRLEIGAKAALDPTLSTAIYADAKTPALALCTVFCLAMANRD